MRGHNDLYNNTQSKKSQPTSDDKEHPPHFIYQCKAEKPDQENETYQQQETTIEFNWKES